MPKMLRQDNGEIYIWHPVLAQRSDMTEYWADDDPEPAPVVDKSKRTRKKAAPKKAVTIDSTAEVVSEANELLAGLE